LIRVHLPPMYTWPIDLHRDDLKIAEVVKKNRFSASGSKAVNQGASTTYIYVGSQRCSGRFFRLIPQINLLKFNLKTISSSDAKVS
jgi:hypothetical protein